MSQHAEISIVSCLLIQYRLITPVWESSVHSEEQRTFRDGRGHFHVRAVHYFPTSDTAVYGPRIKRRICAHTEKGKQRRGTVRALNIQLEEEEWESCVPIHLPSLMTITHYIQL